MWKYLPGLAEDVEGLVNDWAQQERADVLEGGKHEIYVLGMALMSSLFSKCRRAQGTLEGRILAEGSYVEWASNRQDTRSQ